MEKYRNPEKFSKHFNKSPQKVIFTSRMDIFTKTDLATRLPLPLRRLALSHKGTRIRAKQKNTVAVQHVGGRRTIDAWPIQFAAQRYDVVLDASGVAVTRALPLTRVEAVTEAGREDEGLAARVGAILQQTTR